jgi:hypothetical protein
MLKDSYPDIVEAFYDCEICHEPITNPLCPSCLTAEINIWSTYYPNLRKELIPRLNKYLKKLRHETNDTSQCIKCNESGFSICPFCFAKVVLDELEEIRANKQIKKEFLQFFNYSHEPQEYY